MTVWVLGSLGHEQLNSRGVRQARAAERMGEPTHLIATRQALAQTDMTGGKVFLTQLETPPDAIAAFFSAPASQGGRKILNMSPHAEQGEILFGLSDMLIFGQADFATFMQLDREPAGIDDLLVIQPRLIRHNQAAVTILDGIGTVAVWAGKTMLIECFTPDPISSGLPADCVCGAIAAAVSQGIGPEGAMTLACAAASLALDVVPTRAEIEAVIEAAGRPKPVPR